MYSFCAARYQLIQSLGFGDHWFRGLLFVGPKTKTVS